MAGPGNAQPAHLGANSAAQPAISVIVPTRGRPDALCRCLDALGAQDYPHERLEVRIVGDGEAVPALPATGLALTVLEQPWRGPGAARNYGATGATGELLAFTDDDCAPGPSWLRELVSVWQQCPGAAVGGPTADATGRPWSATAEAIVALSRTPGDRGPAFLTSNNVLLDAAGFQAIGGFDPGFALEGAEDRDLCDRWEDSGRPLAWAPAAVVAHHHAHSAASFFTTHVAYGAGAHRLRAARRRRGAPALDVPFYRALPRLLLTGGRGQAIRMVVWALATVSGYLPAAARARVRPWGERRRTS